MKKFLKKYWSELLFFLPLFFFSFWLMFRSFSYDEQKSQILIGSKIWSDFIALLPLIRSFSFGSNFPLEYPLFPEEPIRYHFLFYMIVGLLEKMGFRLDLALNILSALSFFGLLLIIYLLAKLLFKSRLVGFLATVFFLFNGTFSFLEFFKKHSFSSHILSDIYNLTGSVSSFPYGNGQVSTFWKLDVFIDQRHLALAFFLILLIIYLLLKNLEKRNLRQDSIKWLLPAGIIFGLFPSLHKAVFLMAILVLFCLFLFFKKLRLQIILIYLIGLIIALPQLYLTNQLNAQTSGAISFYPGYLVYGQGLLAFLRHWLMNLGLNIFLIPIGFILAPRQAKKVFLAFFSLFIIGNLFKFSPEISANHKFFNLFIIMGNMFSAYGLVRIFHFLRRYSFILATLYFILTTFFLTLSGLIDFFPIKNDFYYRIDDYPVNKIALFIKEKTPPNSIFLNNTYFYHPANLVGRKIFYGWPYFSWSAGYQVDQRIRTIKTIFQSHESKEICQLLKTNKIDYVSLYNQADEELKTDMIFWKASFIPTYEDDQLTIYQVSKICRGF